jgi:hypothetical protein
MSDDITTSNESNEENERDDEQRPGLDYDGDDPKEKKRISGCRRPSKRRGKIKRAPIVNDNGPQKQARENGRRPDPMWRET